MKDDDNNRGRGPRKGGGAGGRGGGKSFGGKGFGGRSGGEGRGPARDGERRPFRSRSASEDRPARDDERKPFRGHSGGDERPARRFERPAGSEGEAPRPRRFDGDRPARFKAEGEDRGFRERSGEERPRRPARTGDRPFPARDRGHGGADRPPRGEGRDGEKRFSRPRSPRFEGAASHEDRPRRPHEAPAERKLITADEPERIAKVMARAGVASRRDSEAMIEEGRVSVNGTVLESPAFDVKPTDIVLIDGEPMPARERTRLWLYHKPRGVVTTNFDPEGRPTVFDVLPEDLPRVLTIGRLDINTEGLLLLTNDGGLARVLELPETGWLRRYRVRAFGDVTQDVLDTVKDGVTIDGIQYGPVTARFERKQGFNTWLTVDLREGKNREVKTVLEHLGLTVNRLIRVSFGPFQLGDLAEGEADEIRSRVLQDQLGTELAAKAGADFESPRRDALPAAPRPAPAGDDRPRRRRDAAEDQHEARREAVRELRGDKPWTRTVWRDAETEPQRERKAPPRRGADPKLERQSREESGTVARRRDKAIADPKGRRVLVERVSAPTREEPVAPRESKRRPDRKPRHERGGEESRAPRSFDRPSGGERPARRPREDFGGRDRAERPDRAPRDGAERPARRFSERPAEDRPRGRSFGDKPGGKSFGAKSFGARSSERPAGGGRPFGGRPSGGRPGGGKGPRPGGSGPRGGGKRG
ncbi:pseudouridine synthase [Bosea sp. F3-2]|uniref:pseudouridine synthase n=1 Tax=Bosea sp. F3-2 TaxID=2599640 RepID=UPI0020BE35E9|nr:pseudouridine synthase [Bosea sp. F3-2]